jgi:hypothetical protein
MVIDGLSVGCLSTPRPALPGVTRARTES